MKIKFHSDDALPPKNTKRYVMMIIFVRSIFYEGSKYYPQIFLDEYFYKL